MNNNYRRLIVAAVLAACLCSPAASLASAFGLDQRPANPGCTLPDRPEQAFDVAVRQSFSALSIPGLQPISMSQPPNDPSRWLIASRQGTLHSFVNDDAVETATVVLDIRDRMQFSDMSPSFSDSEQGGIASFALHPLFPALPYVYVAYNAKPSPGEPVQSVVSRFTSSDGGLTFDSSTEEIVIAVDQEARTHHVGQILFGPDGYLYIGSGDGAVARYALRLNDLRGKILRLDVTSAIGQPEPYLIPPDNPLSANGQRPEIYAWGLRNPWRFSFDRGTGDLWLGDVGWNSFEEINLIENGGNYGWRTFEGNECAGNFACDSTGISFPLLAMPHGDSFAVMGGFVYRGAAIPSLVGTYVFADYVFPGIRVVQFDEQGEPFWTVAVDTPDLIVNFAESLTGELFFFQDQKSDIYQLVPSGGSAVPADGFPQKLSDTGCVDPDDPLQPAPGVIPYTVQSPLWSDGAEKDRWLAIPDGDSITIEADGDLSFPAGTVLMKQFSVDSIPVETRLFVRHEDGGWAGYSYEWNADLTDADLLPAGKVKELDGGSSWTFPGRHQCLACHTAAAGYSLGLEIGQLNGQFQYPASGVTANQLRTLDHIGLFSSGLGVSSVDQLISFAPPSAEHAATGRRAKSYLHANCSGCHRPGGPTSVGFDLRFSTALADMQICEQPPGSSDLGIADASLLTPGDPGSSLISLRMHTLGLNRMPPLGSRVVDLAGTEVVDAWIGQNDVCVAQPDTDNDLTPDHEDNCVLVPNVSQRDSDADGFGNACDPDLDNSGVTNFGDLARIRSAFGTADPHADFDGNGVVNFADLAIFRSGFGSPPGPSALTP